MEFVVGLVMVLVFGIIMLASRHERARYLLKRRHIESLGRLDYIVRVSLPPIAGELVSAAIYEEQDGV
jgi:hypothetical protein